MQPCCQPDTPHMLHKCTEPLGPIRTWKQVDVLAVKLAGLIYDLHAAHVLRQLEEAFDHDDLHQLAQRCMEAGNCSATGSG